MSQICNLIPKSDNILHKALHCENWEFIFCVCFGRLPSPECIFFYLWGICITIIKSHLNEMNEIRYYLHKIKNSLLHLSCIKS